MIYGVMIILCIGFLVSIYLLINEHRVNNQRENAIKRSEAVLSTFECWMAQKIKGHSISEVFQIGNYEKIAIYGLGRIGRCVIAELDKEGCKVEYCVDKNYNEGLYNGLQCFGTNDILPEADLLIVTVPYDYPEIKTQIKPITVNIKHIKSIGEILYAI